MKILIPILLLISVVLCDVQSDIVRPVPGYLDDKTIVYSGYLDLKNSNRSMHYVFVVSINGKGNKDPVTLWLNGGPGCSSLTGYLQQIGPYYLEEGRDYSHGDNLTGNQYSWNNVSNLLFFQTPTGVGYSYNFDRQFHYDDFSTAQDNFNALIDFFSKFREYSSNRFWLAGQSYAGKYIPDLAVRIDHYNEGAMANRIDLRGTFVGNGVISFRDGRVYNNKMVYDIDHYFTDPDVMEYWRYSCQTDPFSAGCRFFEIRAQENTFELNQYNVYGYCYYNDSLILQNGEQRKFQNQQSMLKKMLSKALNRTSGPQYGGPQCSYSRGIYNYFNINELQYHAKYPGINWNGPCADNISYHIDLAGSVESYMILLSKAIARNYHLVMYNGDWDSYIPVQDTVQALNQIFYLLPGFRFPLFTNGQHSGFIELYNGITFATIKGGSHSAAQNRRADMYYFFKAILDGHTGEDFREDLKILASKEKKVEVKDS